MVWKSAKMFLATTATAVVASKVVKYVYKKLFNKESSQPEANDESFETFHFKNREINDVIFFTDDSCRRTIRVPPNKELMICESRELSCLKLLRYIKSARETLDVCMYLITSNEITEQIIRLGQRHVLIRIITDSDMAQAPASQIKKLEGYSFIKVQRSKKSYLIHHKFCIIDGPKAVKRKNALKAYAEKLNVHVQFTNEIAKQPKSRPPKAFVMSGSLNWSTQAMVSNHDSVIVTSNSNIVGKFEKEFECLWMENDPAVSKNDE